MKTWTVDDVMTADVVTATPEMPYRALVDELVGRRVSALPVVDYFGHVVGVVSEADLLRKIEYTDEGSPPRLFASRHHRAERAKSAGRTAGDLMTAPAVTVLTGTSVVRAARLMDAENVKRLPVVDDLGRIAGIVTRSDLLKVHLRPDADIRADVVQEILRRVLAVEEGMVAAVGDHTRAEHGGGDHGGADEHRAQQPGAEYRLLRRARRPAHHVRVGRLGAQRHPGQPVRQ